MTTPKMLVPLAIKQTFLVRCNRY